MTIEDLTEEISAICQPIGEIYVGSFNFGECSVSTINFAFLAADDLVSDGTAYERILHEFKRIWKDNGKPERMFWRMKPNVEKLVEGTDKADYSIRMRFAFI